MTGEALPRSRKDEERREAVRHDRLYGTRLSDNLLMRHRDWEKLDGIAVPLHPYHASVLWLGDVRGRSVLDFGCGDGWLSVILAKRGAYVYGVDVSRQAANVARRRCEVNDVAARTRFVAASAYALPCTAESFDLVIGQAILHHVSDKWAMGLELRRVLRPGGRAVFAEPLGDSLALERLRKLVPIPSAAPDDPDQWRSQLKFEDLKQLGELFQERHQAFHLFSRLDRMTSSERVLGLLGNLDLWLLERVPPLRRYARSVVIELTKT